MRKHWRIYHSGWSAAVKPGRPNRTGAKTVQERIGDGCRRVHCQRFFSSRHGSRYFEVQAPVQGQEGAPEPIPTDSQTAWAQVGERMAQAWETVRKQAETVIQDGEKDEINPWLERTGWLPYLIDMKRPELLACVEEPNSDPNQDEEPVEAAIWEAMDGLVRFSQASVIHQTGVFVRLEAIRTEKHQTRFQPLQPYMDEKSIIEHSRPWKQMLMFFARTQREHTWKSPRYRFTRRQREAWEELVKQAERQVGGDAGEEVDDEMEEEFGDEMEEVEDEMEDDVEEVDDEGVNMNEDGENQNQGSHEPRRLTRIQKACLQFCIQLLNQSITRQKYNSLLVCALAVLGVKKTGWKGPEQYPPILSAVIKVARFIVVQQVLELSEPLREAEFEGDSVYESDSGGRPLLKRCLQFVQKIIDKFIVRGSYGPMQ
ncbi:hypothetical protein BS50DRAFT_658963 [Corynespora cassiicola Philippines]|uniref:Uncharacterized protein n=1 Tax=Corynespora cassiicola Philippines TaxID=1448308 RepID=A0A2T2N178_CORCC|nr:hypothetical protein BS50DRAFT_658963 [Corynespora cassiicola Philippines]